MLHLGIISDARANKSQSPQMHEKALKKAGLNGNYLAFNIKKENLKEAILGLHALGFIGLNVTVPYKEEIKQYLQGISVEAQKIGAVNTLLKTELGYWGYNTDALGFLNSLPEIKNLENNFLVYGAGGASRAILYALKTKFTNIYLLSRNYEKTVKLATEFEVNYIEYNNLNKLQFNTIINCSSASNFEELGAEVNYLNKLNCLKTGQVIDINYNRNNNFWEDLAKKNNLTFQNGLLMLALQAQESFKIWLGQTVEKEIFLNALTS